MDYPFYWVVDNDVTGGHPDTTPETRGDTKGKGGREDRKEGRMPLQFLSSDLGLK